MSMAEPNALTIIDSIQTNAIVETMQKISIFQTVIQKNLKPDHDYGVIPGTEKPTLLKPGAEKILMLMGLTSEYEVIEKVQDYENGFFAFTVKAILTKNGVKITEGVGHANTKESRYRNRWVTESKLPEGVDKSTLKTRQKESKFKEGEYYTEYLLENSDSFTLANTVLKMAKKRSQIDAVLTVASLSEIFTQDLEDMGDIMSGSSGKQQSSATKSKLNKKPSSSNYACTECGQTITQAVHAYSEKNFGRPLCRECQEEAKNQPEPEEAGDIPPAVLKMAEKAGMVTEDFLMFIDEKYAKPWSALSGDEKSEVTRHLHELGQAGA